MLRKIFLKIRLEKNAHCPFCLKRAIGASNIILLTTANNSKVMSLSTITVYAVIIF